MIFVSAPFSHQNEGIVELRMLLVSKYCAKLLTAGFSCLTPLTAGSYILQHVDLPSDFEFWKKMSFDMLEVCTEMHVLKIKGWKESTGVQAEIEFAKSKDIPITYIEEYTLV